MHSTPTSSAAEPARARELALVLAASGALFAFVLRDALFTPGVALVGQAGGEFAHAAARFVARQWLAGDPPWWNPHVGAGAPALGNSALGVLDPQSLPLIAAQRCLGVAGLTAALAWLAWLRLSAAAVGSYALARRLGLRAGGAWIAALSFSGAGFLGLHALDASGRVAWLAPWLLLALERLRVACTPRRQLELALIVALIAAAGQLETAFFVGLLALVWCVALVRENPAVGRSALLAMLCGLALSSPVLAPALDSLARSALALARAARGRALELLDVGLFAVLCGALWRARELGATLADGPRAQRFAVGFAVALTLLALLVATLAPWPDAAPRLVLFDLFGRPDGASQGYWGEGRYAQAAAAWNAPLSLTLAFAGLVAPSLGALRRARIVRLGAALGLSLAAGAPAAVQLAAAAPFAELCDARNAGAVAALLVALLAGAAFEHASAWARQSAAAALALLAGTLVSISAAWTPPQRAAVELEPADGLIALTRGPHAELSRGSASFEGWVHPELPVASAAVRVARAGDGGREAHALPLPLELSRRPWREADSALAPPAALWFRAQDLDVAQLAEGAWSFALVLRDEAGEVLSERVLAASAVERPLRTSVPSLLLVFASAFAVLWLGPRARWASAVCGALIASATLWFHRGLHATTPGEQLFGAPERCAAIAAAAGDGRALCDPGLVSPHAALAQGWRALDARDGLGLASFDAARPLALMAGEHPVLGLRASGLDVRAPLARRFDVRVLAQRGERPQPCAGVTTEQGLRLHRLERFGPASLASSVLPREALASAPRAFDPAFEAWLSGDIAWGPRTPFHESALALVARSNHRIAFDVRLDGDGLLVLGEQLDAGWSASVDGREALLLGVDTLFGGVPLAAGEHKVEFRYRPPLLRAGLFAALLGCAGLALLAFRARAATRA